VHAMDVVAVVGLGYVGLPLAVAYGKNMQTIGYRSGSKSVRLALP
jgi:UDP-N-acetyl-D-galactosamine dehydrogenase